MEIPDAVQALDRDLRGIFGSRLQSLVVYGERARHARAHIHDGHGTDDAPMQTMAVVEQLAGEDLRMCAARVETWHGAGLATPLVLATQEFSRSLDAFPLEFGAIIADHALVSGANLFDGLSVDAADLRRAIEVQARSHLLHLREGYLETRGRSAALAVLIVQSVAAFVALLMSIGRLEGRPTDDPTSAARHAERLLTLQGSAIGEVASLVGVREISSQQADRLFPAYLEAVDRLVRYVDGWNDGR
jgi:hypothetical protein